MVKGKQVINRGGETEVEVMARKSLASINYLRFILHNMAEEQTN